MKQTIESARGLQTALRNIDEANGFLREAESDEDVIRAAEHYQQVKADAGPAFAEAQRVHELEDDGAGAADTPLDVPAEPTPDPVPDAVAAAIDAGEEPPPVPSDASPAEPAEPAVPAEGDDTADETD